MKRAQSIKESVVRRGLDERGADVRATKEQEEASSTNPESAKMRSPSTLSMTSPLRACTRAALSSEANSRQCGAEQPLSVVVVVRRAQSRPAPSTVGLLCSLKVDVASPALRRNAKLQPDPSTRDAPGCRDQRVLDIIPMQSRPGLHLSGAEPQGVLASSPLRTRVDLQRQIVKADHMCNPTNGP